MAGVFALLYGLAVVTSNIVTGSKEIEYNNNARNVALRSGSNLYYDRKGRPHWAANGEEVIIDNSNGNYCIYGKKSLYFYVNLNKQREEAQMSLLDKAIKEAKEKGYKYFQWGFNCQFTTAPNHYVGYEIETGKKYIVIRKEFSGWDLDNNRYFLAYLNDKPVKIYSDYSPGYRIVYEPVFLSKYVDDYSTTKYLMCNHRKRPFKYNNKNYLEDRQYFYYSPLTEITREEFDERTKMISRSLYYQSFGMEN